MNLEQAIRTTAVQQQKSLRDDFLTMQTSGKPGKILPLHYVPLFREDRVSRSNFTVTVEMMETPEMLMNGVNVKVEAHFIPHLAAERFDGMDEFNRADRGEGAAGGGAGPELFKPWTFDNTAEIITTMGIHGVNGQPMDNDFLIEAYNILVNWMRAARSEKITKRSLMDTTLAEAFWTYNRKSHVVPNFDQAMIDGEVPLIVNPYQAKVSGVGVQMSGPGASVHPSHQLIDMVDATGQKVVSDAWVDNGTVEGGLTIQKDPVTGLPLVLAQMSGQTATLSLQTIEMAKRTAHWARIRKQFSESVTDEHIIDILMDGVRVPDEQLSKPFLLDRATSLIGYSRRYATDAANLSKSATNGITEIDIGWVTPPMNTGGIVLITAQIVPDQLYERQKDHYLFLKDHDSVPRVMRDMMDIEKVDIVKNSDIDVQHGQAEETFGYEPLNRKWRRDQVRLGGKYYKPDPAAPFDEDRQKVWTNDKIDPSLTDDFYICSEVHQNVFADIEADPFEIGIRGKADIVGLTVFGDPLTEDDGDYEAVEELVDREKIDQTPTP